MAAHILLCCDHETAEGLCGTHATSSAATVAEARRDATAAGWRFRDGRDLCPGHGRPVDRSQSTRGGRISGPVPGSR